METASLRLKFTPTFKDIQHNNSKCCLEIVPEVSCVRNIDKIEWKQNCDYVEYSIPMTYRIILKKKESEIMDTTDWGKTYHSCVELLNPSSLTSINYAFGDIKRIFSDTIILSSMTSYYQEDIEGKINKYQPKPKETKDQGEAVMGNGEKKDTGLFVDTVVTSDVQLDNIQECLEESNDTTHETVPKNDINKKPSHKDISTEINEFYENVDRKILEHQARSKDTNDQDITHEASSEYIINKKPEDIATGITECYEDDERKTKIHQPKTKETDDQDTTHETPSEYEIDKKPSYKDIEITEALHTIPLETLRKKENSKRQLSITPVCSINTNDKLLEENTLQNTAIDVFSLKSITYRMFESEKVPNPMFFVPRQEYVVNEHTVSYNSLDLERIESIRDLSERTSFYTTNREEPEARVAEFVKQMEAEMLPLKVLLNDVFAKCAKLGLLQNKLITSIKIDQANTDRVVEKQSKSNRVVYTVVFDG